MKQILIALVLVFVVIAVNAKEKESKSDTEGTATMVVSGNVADENSGESLVGVEVKLEGTDLKAYTDFDGNFSLKGVKPGEYKLIANYISYEKELTVLNVKTNETDLKINLQASK
jgi:hypothetical protein